MMGALKDSKNPFFFSLFVAVKFKRFREDPFAKEHQFMYLYSKIEKKNYYCFDKGDDFPDQRWVAERFERK